MIIRPQPDLASVITLLKDANLPTSDLNAEMLSNFFGLYDKNKLIGLIGMEVFVTEVLLRSLVVHPDYKGQGLGKVLVEHFEEQAQLKNVNAIYLLTTTTENFFARLQYQAIKRETVPYSISQTSEFNGLCPSSATVMQKLLINN